MRIPVCISILLLGNLLFAQSLEFESLTCNYQTNPIAIDSKQPLLSWIVKADGFNREQTAYKVLVSSKPELLNEKDADIWNSGKIESAQSAHVKYHCKHSNPVWNYP